MCGKIEITPKKDQERLCSTALASVETQHIGDKLWDDRGQQQRVSERYRDPEPDTTWSQGKPVGDREKRL